MGVRGAQRVVGEPVVRHQQQHACRRRDACQSAGKQAHERADIDQQSQHRDAADSGQHMHRSLARAQVLARGVEAQHFRIGADGEESSGEKGALDDRAWNRLQRVARLGSQRGRALEANETEQRQHQAQAQAAAGHAVEMELFASPQCQPWRTSNSATTITITVTDAASIHSMRRAEIFTSR